MTTIGTILDTIADHQRRRLAEDMAHESLEELRQRLASRRRRPHDLNAALRQPGYSVIAEVKFASPSEGIIATELDPVAVASDYLKNGARALSILTEPHFFKGSLDYLRQVRVAHPEAVLLMKDFLIDPYQVYQGYEAGCDAILIITALVSDDSAMRLLSTARGLGLSALVEIHDHAELERALRCGATLVGVNSRNLKTMAIDPGLTERLAREVPSSVTLVAESGLSRSGDVVRLAKCGCHAFLIGTAFMKTQTPGTALGRLLAECRDGS